MNHAGRTDKSRIIEILSKSFDDNKSVNYILKQDAKREQHIRALMSYSFDICYQFGDVFFTDDKKGCALLLMPDKKKTTWKSIFADAKLAVSVIGASNIKKAINREAAINKIHPKYLFYYLWFIGVDPAEQNKGIGTALLNCVIKEAKMRNRPIYLETSVLKNLPWYEKFGFEIYKELEFDYRLYCMRKE